MKPRRGFTLIELMIVVTILGILMSIAVGRYQDLVMKSNEGATRGNLGSLRSAINIYYGDNQFYPYDNLDCLIEFNRYLPLMPIVRIKHLHPSENNTVLAETTVTDAGGWSYNNVFTDLGMGRASVGCTHSDLRGSPWSAF